VIGIASIGHRLLKTVFLLAVSLDLSKLRMKNVEKKGCFCLKFKYLFVALKKLLFSVVAVTKIVRLQSVIPRWARN